MNKDAFQGGARYVGGKVEKAIGDAVDSRDWKVDGVVDQVAGGAQHTYGRARSIAEDAIDSAPELAAEARNRLHAAGEHIADTAREGGETLVDSIRKAPGLWALAAAAGGYALSWVIHGRRA